MKAQRPSELADQYEQGMLDHASPNSQLRAGNMPFISQVGLGLAAVVATGFVAVYLWVVAGGGDEATLGVLIIWLCTLAILSVSTRQILGWRGFVVGVLIALGLIFLIVGLCFGAIYMSGYNSARS